MEADVDDENGVAAKVENVDMIWDSGAHMTYTSNDLFSENLITNFSRLAALCSVYGRCGRIYVNLLAVVVIVNHHIQFDVGTAILYGQMD